MFHPIDWNVHAVEELDSFFAIDRYGAQRRRRDSIKSLRNERELANTRQKLAELERLIQSSREDESPGQATEMRSLTPPRQPTSRGNQPVCFPRVRQTRRLSVASRPDAIIRLAS